MTVYYDQRRSIGIKKAGFYLTAQTSLACSFISCPRLAISSDQDAPYLWTVTE